MIPLGAALAWLDQAIAREMQRMQARYALSLDELRGVVISDEMATALLGGRTRGGDSVSPEDARVIGAPFAAMAGEFGLCPLGCGLLLLAIAPECSAKYPGLFAYLNDDVQRRWPTQDLARRLLCPPGDMAADRRLRALLSPSLGVDAGGLVASGMLVPAGADEERLPDLLRGWRPGRTLVHHLLALPGFPVAGMRTVVAAPRAGGESVAGAPLLLVTGAGRDGLQLAGEWAERQGKGLLFLESRACGADAREIAEAGIFARLCNCLLAVEAAAPAPAIAQGLSVHRPAVILAPRAEGWATALAPRLVVHKAMPLPTPAARVTLWRHALRDHGLACEDQAFEAVAERYAMPASAIDRAASRAALRGAGEPLSAAQLLAAASAENAPDLDGLAQPVATSATWHDLVLPHGAMEQLRDFASAVATRTRVFDQWGFAAVGRGGSTGLAALFSGGSGTGKTMSAAIIAAELGLDLWRIDLAATVSKYIGETEKNLDRLFSAAGVGNAILFFDEADALFGKRSEVKDSHDRYANVEIAYLLQRLEDHPGIVILATNLSRNLDAAFLRRLPFVIEFPLPDVAAREALWRKAIPPRAPLAASVDLADFATRFELAGGDIRTAALEAAFLAAGRGGTIDAEVIEIAVRRQLMKRGQVPPAARNARTNGHSPAHAPPAH